ncbi:hypothetical protein [Streptomyces sp. NPDC048295]|uniref:hypothetical protein n=1 Tax=Streptomyces sp. NPDC048295 TaxID=3154617 RepID=UPI00341A34DB
MLTKTSTTTASEARLLGGGMSGSVVGLWLFGPRRFGDIAADVGPWLESFCEPAGTKADCDLNFWGASRFGAAFDGDSG